MLVSSLVCFAVSQILHKPHSSYSLPLHDLNAQGPAQVGMTKFYTVTGYFHVGEQNGAHFDPKKVSAYAANAANLGEFSTGVTWISAPFTAGPTLHADVGDAPDQGDIYDFTIQFDGSKLDGGAPNGKLMLAFFLPGFVEEAAVKGNPKEVVNTVEYSMVAGKSPTKPQQVLIHPAAEAYVKRLHLKESDPRSRAWHDIINALGEAAEAPRKFHSDIVPQLHKLQHLNLFEARFSTDSIVPIDVLRKWRPAILDPDWSTEYFRNNVAPNMTPGDDTINWSNDNVNAKTGNDILLGTGSPKWNSIDADFQKGNVDDGRSFFVNFNKNHGGGGGNKVNTLFVWLQGSTSSVDETANSYEDIITETSGVVRSVPSSHP